MRLIAALAVVAFAAMGCSATDEGARRSTKKDAATPGPGGDAAAVGSDGGIRRDADPDFAVPHPPLPEIQKQSGPVVASPKFIAITFPNDPLRAEIEDFVSRVGSTPYWATIAAEYGVGAGTSGNPVHLAANPATEIDDLQVQAFIRDSLASGTFGTFDPSAVYTLFYPQTTSVTLQGTRSCTSFGGYHSETALTNGQKVVYAVIPRCPTIAGLIGIDAVTTSASHELVEACTDPFFFTDPAWKAPADEHLAWSLLLGGGENSDLCAQNVGTHFKPDGFDFTVQRSWSNAAARTGSDPCVPARSDVYFNAAPVLTDTITVADEQPSGVRSVRLKGVQLTAGQSKTIDLVLFSTGPIGDWKLGALDRSSVRGRPPQLEFSFSQPSGKNGDRVQLTIKALTSTAAGVPFLIQSRIDGQTNIFAAMAGE